LDLPGWKRLKGLAKWQKKFEITIKQAKLHAAPKYKYRYKVPRYYVHAIQLDE
jgi:hypothetical protein